MKNISQVAVSLLASAAVFGCGGTAGDPKTLGLSDLNPPGTLYTVTQSASIQLRWPTGNFEKDFKTAGGYYVFATTKSLTDIKALAKYPSGVDVTKSGIPRCKDNSAFFEAFGLKAATNECSGAINSGDTDSTTTSSTSTSSKLSLTSSLSGFQMMADSSTAEKMTNYQECTESAGGVVSLPVTAGQTSKDVKKCTVKKAYDPTTKASVTIANGTSYVFMAMTVAGSSYAKVSWSSNVVSDTPSSEAYKGDITLSSVSFRSFTFNSSFDTATLTTEKLCSAAGSGSTPCNVTGTNAETTEALYIARDNVSTSNRQRILISTSSSGTIRILDRGQQTYDPFDPAVTNARTPEDAAIATATSSPYSPVGTVLAVYEDRVYDILITSSAGVNRYGKIVIGDTKYDSTTTNTSAVTIPVTIILQSKAESIDYFARPFFK